MFNFMKILFEQILRLRFMSLNRIFCLCIHMARTSWLQTDKYRRYKTGVVLKTCSLRLYKERGAVSALNASLKMCACCVIFAFVDCVCFFFFFFLLFFHFHLSKIPSGCQTAKVQIYMLPHLIRVCTRWYHKKHIQQMIQPPPVHNENSW